MEIFIIICLLAIIMLLVLDKFKFKNSSDRTAMKDSIPEGQLNILGNSKSTDCLLMSKSASNYKKMQMVTGSANLVHDNEPIIDHSDIESLDEIEDESDWIEEEEELQKYSISSIDNSLAQGVTFEELSYMGTLLQKERLESYQKKITVNLVQKIYGTELFNLLENSIKDVSQNIAELLDHNLPTTHPSSSIIRRNDFDDFDITDFN